jgi:hypothetical protein
LWTLEETEEGDVQIAFETSTEELAGRVIEFYLVDPHSKRACHNQRVTLEPTRTPGKWEGWCSIGPQTEIQGPYELIFEIVPLEEME